MRLGVAKAGDVIEGALASGMMAVRGWLRA
jgi:hypothetical protein